MVRYTQNTQVCDESLSFTCWLLVISSTNESDHHDLTEMLLKVEFYTHNPKVITLLLEFCNDIKWKS
jgi:hypothetical protein